MSRVMMGENVVTSSIKSVICKLTLTYCHMVRTEKFTKNKRMMTLREKSLVPVFIVYYLNIIQFHNILLFVFIYLTSYLITHGIIIEKHLALKKQI